MGMINAQDSLTVDIDILKEIQSPAANLLGIANTDIAKPSDPSAFMLSLRQATSNFTQVPNNYAIDFAPVWVFGGKNISATEFMSSKPKYSIPQSLVVSFAINNDDVQDSTGARKNTALGLGFKFSILRGKVSQKTNENIDQSLALMASLNEEISEAYESLSSVNKTYNDAIGEMADPGTSSDRRSELTKIIEAEQGKMYKEAQSVVSKYSVKFKSLGQNIDFNREQFKLDFNGAMSINFADQIYENGEVNKVAAWLTGSYEWKSGLSVLGIARYLYNPDQGFLDDLGIMMVDDLSIFNFGGKLQYSKNRFSSSFELLSQSSLNNDAVESGTKYLFNAQYKLDDNVVLSFVFGKDYDNMFTEQGNVISALNFLMGLGSKREVKRAD